MIHANHNSTCFFMNRLGLIISCVVLIGNLLVFGDMSKISCFDVLLHYSLVILCKDAVVSAVPDELFDYTGPGLGESIKKKGE